MKKRTTSTGRLPDRFVLRLPNGMHEQIAALADSNGRSMNSQIVYCLESFLQPGGGETVELDERIRSLERRSEKNEELISEIFLILLNRDTRVAG